MLLYKRKRKPKKSFRKQIRIRIIIIIIITQENKYNILIGIYILFVLD